MSSIRINLSMALITLVVLISTLEVQRGVLAIEQVSHIMYAVYLIFSVVFFIIPNHYFTHMQTMPHADIYTNTKQNQLRGIAFM